MATVKCESGLHYYDDSRFDKCPYCGVKLNRIQPGGFAYQANDVKTISKSGTQPKVNQIYMENAAQRFNVGEMDDQKTIGFISATRGNDYVTGWLVCIEGPERGRDYRLHHGINKVGRRFDMDVIISEDQYISNDTHCSIAYDKRHNEFYITPNGGTLTYKNGDVLIEASHLQMGDKIQIGMSLFEFVPFCRDNTTWEDKR